MIKSAASAASPAAQKIVKNVGKIAFLGPLYRDSYRQLLLGEAAAAPSAAPLASCSSFCSCFCSISAAAPAEAYRIYMKGSNLTFFNDFWAILGLP